MDESKKTKAIFFKMPHAKAPDFVIGQISLKRSEFMTWLETQDDNLNEDWLNMDILQPQDSTKNPYLKVNTWKPEKPKSGFDEFNQDPSPEIVNIMADSNDDLPF